ncbi:hypothetical protein [Noviherbaspirillum soli]|uniref:hypothetical protein n=1 Tax=Noviherbaspirillum soli TaxID=1064518 RepID=UPI00188A1ED5|nr:hypothetical protein [Noviherbaspirillum soli]
MKIKTLLLSFASFVLTACGSMQTVDGPGMITTFKSLMNGRSAYMLSLTLSNGKSAMTPFSVSGGKAASWRQAPGSTTGMSGDTRALPEWIDFSWKETAYPSPKPSSFASDDEYGKYLSDEKARLPLKTQRVFISSRIPPEVIQEVTYSRSHIPKGQHLPEKMLWIYFIWTDDGIKFRWKMSCDKPCVEKGGGDEIN